MKESAIQIILCNYLSSRGYFFFSIANEAFLMAAKVAGMDEEKSFALMTNLKKMGLTPGIPDLGILENKTIYFIETKTLKGELSKSQKIIIPILKEMGYNVEIARNLVQLQHHLKIWRIDK